MAKIRPGEAFRVTDPLTSEEAREWDECEKEMRAAAEACDARRSRNIPPFTEEQLKQTEQMIMEIVAKRTRPDKFTGDLSHSAPPIYVDGDDPLNRRSPDDYCAQMAAAAPSDALVIAPLGAVMEHDSYALICMTAITTPLRRVLNTFDSRLRCARLSNTEYTGIGDIVDSIGFMSYVHEGPDGLHLFAVYGRFAATCKLTRIESRQTLVITGYCFTEAPH